MRDDVVPVRSVVEHGAGAGNYIIELVEHEDAALRDGWEGTDGAVRIQPGRVGLESVAEMHYPEVVLQAFAQEPAEELAGALVPGR